MTSRTATRPCHCATTPWPALSSWSSPSSGATKWATRWRGAFLNQSGELLASLSDFGLTEARLDVRWRTQALSLAVSYEVAFYDAAYHAVALVHGGVFVTADERYVARASSAGGVETLRQWRS